MCSGWSEFARLHRRAAAKRAAGDVSDAVSIVPKKKKGDDIRL